MLKRTVSVVYLGDTPATAAPVVEPDAITLGRPGKIARTGATRSVTQDPQPPSQDTQDPQPPSQDDSSTAYWARVHGHKHVVLWQSSPLVPPDAHKTLKLCVFRPGRKWSREYPDLWRRMACLNRLGATKRLRICDLQRRGIGIL
ncbi:hypothetical protein AURDEDRAFT_175498 [Auricularia subglabra TFB-10046 SS5]|uniref:Uncharacterized protein n=1 Tax=Auricularia subglabra (strain TFB-10046 / SS5) TaxID=717982 RepID=J0WRQ0_AURST|nr:hypothetical protein AURDEDRAFT_175498 [Auricularia subglabra TFB-10046 SS5]